MGHRIWRQAFGYRNVNECLDSTLGTRMITEENDRDDYDGKVPLCSFEYGYVLSGFFDISHFFIILS